jgi:hypothetical protein
VARLRALAERPLAPDEYRRRMRRHIPAEELAEMQALIAWFLRRYPTVRERLAYVRRATAAWRRSQPPAR